MDSPINATIINDVWDRYIIDFDDAVGGSSEDFKIFNEADNHEKNIKLLIDHYSHLLNENISFFKENDYSWSFDPKSYRLGAEANLQFRLIAMLINLHETVPSYRIAIREPIIVREAIVTGASVIPRAIYREGLTFILFPLGWFEYEHFACYGMQMMMGNNQNGFRACVLGWGAKILAEEAINKFSDDHHEWSIEPVDATLLCLELSKFLIKEHLDFSGATLEVMDISDLSQLIAYACESFVLAHETAHILVGEHRSDLEANEQKADELAFEILKLSKESMITGEVGITSESLHIFAALSFIFIINGSLEAQAQLSTISPKQLDIFRERSLLIQESIKDIVLSENDKIRLNYLVHYMHLSLQSSKEILCEVSNTKDKALDLAQGKLLQLLNS